MRRFLFASVAASGLALAALPAFAQLTTPLPSAPPPVATPAPNADVSAEERTGNAVQTPEAPANVTGEATANATTSVPPTAETTTQAEAQADAAEAIPATPTPRVAAQTPTPATPSVAAQAAAPSQATAAGTAPATPATAQAVEAAAGGATPTPVNASAVCQPRTTSVHFGARGSALSQQNRNAIEYAVDSASVCSLQSVVIADSGTGGVSSRRASVVRSALVRQGVPADRISVEHATDADASTGELNVRMQFAGLAGAGPAMAEATQTMSAPSTPAQPQTPPASEPSGR